MDWNLKAASPTWDLTEFPPQETILTTLPDGLTSASAPQCDSSVDLKLGQVSYGAGVVSKETDKVAGPTKRSRGEVNNVVCQAVSSCLVDGCDADLSSSREYHRRHKVCELHSKTPEVTIGGHKQRFCQQCSRFHSLEEFDEGKRSCRKRLEGHNRRRRKPQPDLLIRSPVVNCLSSYQGTSRDSPSFSNTNPIYSSAAAVENQHIWLGGANHPESKAAAALYNQQLLLSSSSFSFLHSTMFGPPSRGSRSSSNNMYFCEGLSLQDTDCALSLLSSPCLQMIQPPPPVLGLHQGTSSSSSATTTTHCTSLVDDNSPFQTLPFQWD